MPVYFICQLHLNYFLLPFTIYIIPPSTHYRHRTSCSLHLIYFTTSPIYHFSHFFILSPYTLGGTPRTWCERGAPCARQGLAPLRSQLLALRGTAASQSFTKHGARLSRPGLGAGRWLVNECWVLAWRVGHSELVLLNHQLLLIGPSFQPSLVEKLRLFLQFPQSAACLRDGSALSLLWLGPSCAISR